MKHTIKSTIIVLVLFTLAQFFGLFTLQKSISAVKFEKGSVVVEYKDTAIGKRPEVKGVELFTYMTSGILFGTLLLLFLIFIRKLGIWKVLYFLAVWMSMSVALGVFVDSLIAILLSFLLSLIKISRKSAIVYNITEILIYAGIAVIFVPLLDILWVTMLLFVTSLYDIIAVFKTKHMVKIAESLTKEGIFSGFMVPYKAFTKPQAKKIARGERLAILGGGDIAFPLLFSGVVMNNLIKLGMEREEALLRVSPIPIMTIIMLLFLFLIAKKDRYYPAMPFIFMGCLLGALLTIIWF
ncbi:MAG TPA: hypothetical protein ENG42_00790 [Candidatus Aenigmarchaeota archaeon]|nr:MAG: hypothetical protein DRP03_00930 [Candidatus Aenigmarchaeota archaeon]HDD45987.1 hypothetical protein [Candidatus Aenigmarchaeota archaeon]